MSVVCVASGARASANDVASVVRRAYPTSEVIHTVSGDLNTDGIPDIAALVRDGTYPNASIRLVTLRGTATGFVLWEQSNDLGAFPKGEPDIQIKRGSLFMYSTAATCCAVEYEHDQFKYGDDHFRLIGVTVGENKEGDGEVKYMDDENSEVSLNLLTGERREIREVKGQKAQLNSSRVPALAQRIFEKFSGSYEDEKLTQILMPTTESNKSFKPNPRRGSD